MFKAVFFLIIIFFQFFILPFQTFASEDCSTAASGNITYEPKAFPPPTGNLVLNFTINNDNAYNNTLKGRDVRLHFSILPIVGDRNTTQVTIPTDSRSFAISLGDDSMKSPGDHEGVLDLKKPNGSFEEYCKGIKYSVGDANLCVIDPTLQSPIPPSPNNIFPLVKFSGKPNTKYYLFISGKNDLACSARAACTPITNTDTDSSGQGAFPNVEIKGNVGETKIIRLGINNFQTNCSSKEIQISASAPIPTTPPTGPVSTPPPGTTIGPGGTAIVPKLICPGDPRCTSAAGETCPGDKGIKTAIGCIHTDPAGFVKDFLSFAVAISGGLAFLMMLLGTFQMLTSAGNPETLQAGRERFSSAIIGLLIVVLSVLLLKIIGVDILKIPGFTG